AVSGPHPPREKASSGSPGATKAAGSVPPGVLDAALGLPDRVVHEADGVPAMSTLVVGGRVELLARGTEVIQRRLHVRLVGFRGGRPGDDGGNPKDRSGGEHFAASELGHESSLYSRMI